MSVAYFDNDYKLDVICSRFLSASVNRGQTEYVLLFVRWIFPADIVHINIAHGVVCRRICMGAQVHERHIIYVSGECLMIRTLYDEHLRRKLLLKCYREPYRTTLSILSMRQFASINCCLFFL